MEALAREIEAAGQQQRPAWPALTAKAEAKVKAKAAKEKREPEGGPPLLVAAATTTTTGTASAVKQRAAGATSAGTTGAVAIAMAIGALTTGG